MVRLKNRYILFEVIEPARAPEAKVLVNVLRLSILQNFGAVTSGLLASSMNGSFLPKGAQGDADDGKSNIGVKKLAKESFKLTGRTIGLLGQVSR